MKRIPKTPVEFDYDLWTTEDGKCMVRVKLTGEVTEVAREVMKILRAEEKKLRRSFTGEASENSEDGDMNTILSLDALPDDDVKSAAWLTDYRDFVREVMVGEMEKDFRGMLTNAQREIYEVVLLGGMKPYDYAKRKGISASSVTQHIHAIQKKVKKFFVF